MTTPMDPAIKAARALARHAYRSGMVIGRLTLQVRTRAARRVKWTCLCSCGEVTTAQQSDIASGKTRSCGCLRNETVRFRRLKHGATGPDRPRPEYTSLRHAIGRCHNKKNAKYSLYGGRGIYVCAGWRTDFDTFYCDLGPKPTPSHTIDRIDNDGSYTCGHCTDCIARGAPLNCKWSTKREQGNNTRRTKLLTVGGVTKPLTEWCEERGLPASSVRRRLALGWSDSAAITVPVLPRPYRRKVAA